MSGIKFHGWDKKPRTMIRYIKPGDIFAFERRGGGYRFGRIMTKVSIGNVAEIFVYKSDQPILPEPVIFDGRRAWGPACIDSYTSFDRKRQGEWRIIGYQEGYEPSGYEGVYFVYGSPGSYKRVDIFDDEIAIDRAEFERWPPYTPYRDSQVQEQLDELGLD